MFAVYNSYDVGGGMSGPFGGGKPYKRSGSKNRKSSSSSSSENPPTLFCQFCRRSFTKKFNLQIHERTHLSENERRSKSPTNHSNNNNNNSKPYNSGYFGGFGSYEKQRKTFGIGLSQCDICGKVFRKYDSMKNHRVLHSPPLVPREFKGFLTECVTY